MALLQSWKTTVSLKQALWQTVKAVMNCRKHNTTFHQDLRTFQRKALHLGNKQNL